jgi:hypothetical protein
MNQEHKDRLELMEAQLRLLDVPLPTPRKCRECDGRGKLHVHKHHSRYDKYKKCHHCDGLGLVYMTATARDTHLNNQSGYYAAVFYTLMNELLMRGLLEQDNPLKFKEE